MPLRNPPHHAPPLRRAWSIRPSEQRAQSIGLGALIIHNLLIKKKNRNEKFPNFTA